MICLRSAHQSGHQLSLMHFIMHVTASLNPTKLNACIGVIQLQGAYILLVSESNSSIRTSHIRFGLKLGQIGSGTKWDKSSIFFSVSQNEEKKHLKMSKICPIWWQFGPNRGEN